MPSPPAAACGCSLANTGQIGADVFLSIGLYGKTVCYLAFQYQPGSNVFDMTVARIQASSAAISINIVPQTTPKEVGLTKLCSVG